MKNQLKPKHQIVQVDPSFILRNMARLKDVLNTAFNGSVFNSDYSVESPFEETLALASNPPRVGIKHLIVFSETQEILGGILSIDTHPTATQIDADCGWFFTVPSLPPLTRVKLAAELVAKAVQLARSGGFRRMVTRMGTQAGERFLRHNGFKRHVADHSNELWVLELDQFQEFQMSALRSR